MNLLKLCFEFATDRSNRISPSLISLGANGPNQFCLNDMLSFIQAVLANGGKTGDHLPTAAKLSMALSK